MIAEWDLYGTHVWRAESAAIPGTWYLVHDRALAQHSTYRNGKDIIYVDDVLHCRLIDITAQLWL